MKAILRLMLPGTALAVVLATASNASAFYDTSVGRWLKRDPTGERGGVNLYGFMGNNPVLYSDKWGLSPADVKWLLNLAQQCAGKMTEEKYRTDPGELNNILSTSSAIWNKCFKSARPMKWGCDAQAANLAQAMDGAPTDDKWVFNYYSTSTYYLGIPYPLPHQVIIAVSSNPDDPQIILDPWANEFEAQYGMHGLDSSCSTASPYSTSDIGSWWKSPPLPAKGPPYFGPFRGR